MTISELSELKEICKTEYSKDQRRMKMLDMTDNCEFWQALNAKYPSYQILPDTNFVSYIKANLLASIYTIGKSATLQPTSEKDVEITQQLNVWLENHWDTAKVAHMQFLAGERAALCNLGITQVGWQESVSSGRQQPGESRTCVLKNIDPIKFMRDPYAVDLDHAGYCMTYEDFHKSIFLEDKNYVDEFKKYQAKQVGNVVADAPSYSSEKRNATKDNYTLWIFWVWEDGKLNEYHTINCEAILYKKEGIKPNKFPFALLYCNAPGKRLVGASEPAKIFANNTAYNVMDSIILTSEYKNQRPPKFITSSSGLNLNAFKKFGNEADHTFVVNGPANQAVHYHEYPQTSPVAMSAKMSLQNGIQTMSGVDSRYTGRDTGSIMTTGGIEAMLDRATLIDTPKVMMYENYAATLTELILRFFLEFSPNREYFVKSAKTNKWETIDMPFLDIEADTVFRYSINISSELPKNKARTAAIANSLMEKQMQYGNQSGAPELLTQEEWLMMMDLPNREYMLERMGVQRQNSAIEDVSQTLFTYANLVKQGIPPDEAIMATASTMEKKRKGEEMEEEPVPFVSQEQPQPFQPQQQQAPQMQQGPPPGMF